ncbi:MAG: NAD(P)/FAD-dependent oxidoreductase [Anaerolineae bacterium]|nr:MAG: NAD(P)/FAD-dependent oxidoreductase [Anaerolineae bacterium]
MNEKNKNIAIIGAGMTGMAAAYDLVRAGHRVTIYEASDGVGGLARGFKEPHWDWSVEYFYHHWFASDAHILGLIAELGLSEKVLFPRPYTVVLHNGRWYPFDSILEALRFPGLGWGVDKVRFGLVGLYLRLTKNWRALERVTAEEWMRRWAGERVYNRMWRPLLEGKFGRYSRDVPMSWLWARIHARTTRLGTYRGGFQAFCDDFAARLRRLGVKILLNRPVRLIRPAGQTPGLTVDTPGEQETYDHVLVTVSPASFARLSPDLPAAYLQGLREMKSMGAVVLVLALKHRLSEEGYYWFNLPKEAGYPFLALVEHTNYLSPEYFGGDHIVYCGDYLDPDHEYFSLSKEELLARFLPALKRFNPDFETDWVRDAWLFKTNYAQPVPEINHSQRIPPIETPIPGLYFASMSQVYPWDRGTNFAVEIGRRAARLMLGSD